MLWTELLNDKKVVDKRVRRKGHFRHHDELGCENGDSRTVPYLFQYQRVVCLSNFYRPEKWAERPIFRSARP